MNKRVVSLLGLLVLAVPSLQAAEVSISGYASFKGTYADNDSNVSYYNKLANTKNADFDTRDNHLGIQLNAPMSDKMDMTVVLSAEGGPNSQYNITTEWAYANYQLNPDWGLRIGKVKGPFYMVSDYRDVGYAYPWVRPPTEVYSTNPMKSLTGIDLVFQKSVGDFNYLLELFSGSGHHQAIALPNAINSGNMAGFGIPAVNPNTGVSNVGSQVSFETHAMYGFNASVGTDAITFRAGYFQTKVDFGPYQDLDGKFGGVGLTVDWNNIVVYSEYIERDTHTTLQAAFPDQKAGYLTLGYRIGNYLPYVNYATLDKGKDNSPFAMIQDSIALGLRVEVDDAAALKFEVLEAEPDSEAGDIGRYGLFDAPLPVGTKGTVYTVSFDVIF